MNSPKLLYAQYKLALTTADPRAVDGIKNYVEYLKSECERMKQFKLPCGHSISNVIGAVDGRKSTQYCGQCADDSLRANIAAGVEL